MEISDGEALSSKSNKREISSELSPVDWHPLVLTKEKIVSIWEKLQAFPQVFDDFSKGNFEEFVGKLMFKHNLFVEIGDELGLAAGFAVRPGVDMVLHLVMFDKRLRGREPVFLNIMEHFFSALQLHRMTAMIASDCVTAIRLAQRLGFRQEGIMRGAVLRNGKLLDMHIYGILHEEFLDEIAAQSARSAQHQAVNA